MTSRFVFKQFGLSPAPMLCEVERGDRQTATQHPVSESPVELSPEDATLALLEATNRVMARLLPIARRQSPVVGGDAGGHQ